MALNAAETQIYFRAKNPNPLFTEWLEYWLKEAEKKDSLKKHSFAKALESLQKFPLVLHTGRDCAILEGFGSSICEMIDKQLQVYKESNPGRLLTEKQMDFRENSIIFEAKEKLNANRKKIANKETIQFTNRMNDTLEAFLNNPNNNIDEDDDLLAAVCSPPRKTTDDCMPQKVELAHGTYEIFLLVDTQETAGKSKRSLDTTLKTLEKRKVNFEVRRLPVGDFLWICRSKNNKEHELVLPYIIERKRMDDLASSIKDGRYHEQKFRLNDCGLPNKIYLIESRGNNAYIGLPITNLLQATTNVQVHNDFTVKFTDSNEDSMLYLAVMTNLLNKIFHGKTVVQSTRDELDQLSGDYYGALDKKIEIELMCFSEFSAKAGKMKNFTIRDMFMRQLVSLKSLSVEKATSISTIYPTPESLMRAYYRCLDDQEAANLLANIPCGKLKRPLGATISQVIHKLYNSKSYNS